MMANEIREIWAWIGVLENGDEGVLSAKTSAGAVPMIHITRLGVEMLRPHAEQCAELGIEVRLTCFSNREDFETLTSTIKEQVP